MKEKIVNELNKQLQNASPEEVILFFLNKYKEKIAFSSSLGAEDQVLTEMIASINSTVRIFTLDTGRLFPETYDLIQKTNSRYKINIEIFFPNAKNVENMVNHKGINLFYESIENRKLCCHTRKIEPLQRAFKGLDAWICGLRKEQSVTRTDCKLIEWDKQNQIIKVNPLIDWTDNMVWDYIKQKNIPYNILHDKGFPSIGCQPCTRAIKQGDDIRSGRWWWEQPEYKECGLHEN
ncbi:MAG: phosphoadenylyl-sulfate reductase [Bacteroidales bacterium]|nr:phosphoadenylyl-sulfate reductase [Bacteroidales bacterium]